MSLQMKKLLSVLVIIVIILGYGITFLGAGPVKPAKDQLKLGLDIKGGVFVVMEAQTDKSGDELKKLMEQTQAVIEQRVNQMGLSEPVVTIEGEKRIRVELPGAEDADEAIAQIGKTAQLVFLLADGTVALDGSMIKNAETQMDAKHGGYSISLEFNKEGTAAFAEATRKASAGVESKIEGVAPTAIAIVLDNEIISAPLVDSPIENGNAEITRSTTGGYSQEEATMTAALIRGGALPVALEEIETSTKTATIGFDAFEISVKAGAVGIVLVLLLMLFVYGVMGVAADIALMLYILIDLWVMILFGSVLTLPGIAGLILSVGMAVDANVIIFARIREEIANGKSVRASVQSGFRRALSTILDSQITTMIAAIVLYQFGTGQVRGFAMTLMIGIVASIFTATVITQLFLSVFSEGKLLNAKKFFGMNEDNTYKHKINKSFDFIKHRKIYYIAAAAIVIVGIGTGMVRGYNYGIDFTGGTMMQIDMGQQVAISEVSKDLKQLGISASDIVYAGDGNKQVIIRTTDSLDNEARAKVVDTFTKNYGIEEDDVLSVEQFGPSVGKELRMNAVKALLIASVGMLIYIVFRFEWKFGVASIFGVGHDILMILALYGLFNVSINSPFIAGILTVAGYSINDTIVVFDRIRENLGIMNKKKTDELINTSINQTLFRSLMTSATTLLVMVPMIILTGDAIRGFLLPLVIGILVGTLSSICMCSPLYYDLCNVTGGPKYRAKKAKSNK